jgi:hypothetical protein
MMGRREVGQGQFFYSFDLDKVVPPDHLVRHQPGDDRALGEARRAEARHCTQSGRLGACPTSTSVTWKNCSRFHKAIAARSIKSLTASTTDCDCEA